MGKRTLPTMSVRDRELEAMRTFWNTLPKIEVTDGVLGELLAQLRKRAEECMHRSPPDLKGLKAVTAEAFYWLIESDES
jgi:hypothetical protein